MLSFIMLKKLLPFKRNIDHSINGYLNFLLMIFLVIILFKQKFKFTGGEITKEFLMSTGIIKGAHIPSCPIYIKQEKLKSL